MLTITKKITNTDTAFNDNLSIALGLMYSTLGYKIPVSD